MINIVKSIIKKIKDITTKYHLHFLRRIIRKIFISYYTWRLVPVPAFWKEILQYDSTPPKFSEYSTLSRKEFYQLVIKESPSIITGSILDVGCGFGELLKYYSIVNKSSKIKYFGLECDVSRAKEAKIYFPKMISVVGSIYNPPFKPESFDLIFMTQVLEHLESPKIAIEQAYALLKPNGFLIISVPYGRKDFCLEHINFWTPKTFTKLTKEWPVERLELISDNYVIFTIIRKK